MLFLFAALAAAAIPTPIIDSDVLGPDLAHPDGYGAPSVVFSAGSFSVYAEASIPAPVGCAEAYEVTVADTVDGVTYTAPTVVAGVSASTPCGVRAPGAVRLDSGVDVVALEDVSTGALAILQGGTVSVTTLVGYGEPSLVRFGSTWYLFARRSSDGSLVELSSPDLATWTFGRVLVATSATVPDLWSPSLSCLDAPGGTTWPFEGGFEEYRPAAGGSIRGRDLTIRNTWATYVGATRDTWASSDPAAWVSIDAVKATAPSSARAFWFETIDSSGASHIGIGGTLPTVVTGRDCH